ncbi:MAG: hypothetical protein LBC85_02765 [Fibromonadaceae bacterium]|jgi:hypothetical protein|nr:hypothetical protein [Fibromonadaceae bacterium]
MNMKHPIVFFFSCAILALFGCGGDTDDQLELTYSLCGDVATGSSTMTCGGQTYKTVQIGSQTWMAENLNFDVSGSACYDNNSSNCDTYGRLYNL